MTDIIEVRSEDAIPEFEELLLIWNKEEVQTIIKMRKEHEHKILRPLKSIGDFVNYINYETKLLQVIQFRVKQKEERIKSSALSDLEPAQVKRMNRLFITAVQTFPSDLKMWVTYIKFCKETKLDKTGSQVVEQILQLHGHEQADLYQLAASWELFECDSMEKARKYILNGIHVHKDNKALLVDAFKLELIDSDRKRKKAQEKFGTYFASGNPLHSTRKAEMILDCSLKKMNDVELLRDLLYICKKYNFTDDLINKIISALEDHKDNERTWDIIAEWELNRGSGEKSLLMTKLGEYALIYEQGVKRLNTPRMWNFYINALVKLTQENSPLPNYKRKLLLTALQKGSTANKLSEKHYLIWAKLLEESQKHKKQTEVLQKGVKQLPESVVLWQHLLRAHIIQNEETEVNQVFEQGVAALNKTSLPLWNLILQYELTKTKNKVEDIYKKSLTMCSEISNALKPMYLEWMLLTQGIKPTRKCYDTMCELPSPCLEMHRKMIQLEVIQPTLNLKRARLSHTIACAQFGDRNPDVWMDFCKFELKEGDPNRVGDIYKRAQVNLTAEKFDSFMSEYSFIRAIPQSE